MELLKTSVQIRLAQVKEETRTYEIKGTQEQLDNLEGLFWWIQSLGHLGHSATAELWVDGDGSARLSFEGLKEENKKKGKLNEEKDPEYKVGLD